MKTAYIKFSPKEEAWIPFDASGEQCAMEATEYDDAVRNAEDAGYLNTVYVPRVPVLVAKA